MASFLGLVLFLGLFPASFKGVEYYEYGFLVRSSTGKVDISRIYKPGTYFVGPDYYMKKFKADAHIVRYDAISVFSAGATNTSIGLEFKLDVTFAYKLREANLVDLHEELEKSYSGVIDARARDAIKNAAVVLDFSSFFEERQEIESVLRAALEERLRPLHCDLVSFHLGRVEIPDEVRQKQLETKIQNERNDRESFEQQAEVERKLTEYQVNLVLLDKTQVLRTAQAEADFITLSAVAEAEKMERQAQSAGLSALYNATGLVLDKHKASFDYIRTVLRHETSNLNVGYIDEATASTVNVD